MASSSDAIFLLCEEFYMSRKICCFAGHGKYSIDKDTEEKLYEKCEDLILNEGVSEFWVGHYGSFDGTASATIRKLQKIYPEVQLCLVIPYVTKGIDDYKELYYKDYNEILVADMPENTPKKFQIIKCNQYMVDNSDFLIAYVNFSFGGAVKTLEYALKKKHIQVFNLGTWQE